MERKSIWVTPDGTVHTNKQSGGHIALLIEVGHACEDDDEPHIAAFADGWLRAVIRDEELCLQWGGTLTAAQRNAAKNLSLGLDWIFCAAAEAGYDPEPGGFAKTTAGFLSRSDSAFKRLFNVALRKCFSHWREDR